MDYLRRRASDAAILENGRPAAVRLGSYVMSVTRTQSVSDLRNVTASPISIEAASKDVGASRRAFDTVGFHSALALHKFSSR